jgi:hypothetical protein
MPLTTPIVQNVNVVAGQSAAIQIQLCDGTAYTHTFSATAMPIFSSTRYIGDGVLLDQVYDGKYFNYTGTYSLVVNSPLMVWQGGTNGRVAYTAATNLSVLTYAGEQPLPVTRNGGLVTVGVTTLPAPSYAGDEMTTGNARRANYLVVSNGRTVAGGTIFITDPAPTPPPGLSICSVTVTR